MQKVQEFMKGFIFHCEYEKNLSPKTLKAYQTDLRQFAEFLGGKEAGDSIDFVDKHILREYIKVISNGNMPRTINRKLATLKAFFNFLEYEDSIVVNPFRKMKLHIKEGKQLPKTIPRSKLSALFNSVYTLRRTQSENAGIPVPTLVRDIAILELLVSAGVRVTELCCLKEADVDLQRGSVKIMGKGSRERLVPLCGEHDILALTQYATLYRQEIQSSGWFFLNRCGRRYSEQSVRNMVKKYGKAANLAMRVTPHMFRHSVATQLLENGVYIRYIQAFLGHSTITTTQIYAQVTDEYQRQTLESRHPRRELG